MQVEITGETERLIQAALATGQFGSIDELLAALTRQLPTQSPVRELPDRIDVDELATDQGVDVYRVGHKVPADLWPEDESVDEFLGCIRELRRAESAASRIR